jgi:hypothetical protein
MNKNDTICSRAGVERYLLNRMSPEEETLFQEHLRTCRACNAYLSAARSLAGLVSEEPLQQLTAPRKPASAFTVPLLLRWVSVAACLLLVGGLTFYLSRRPVGEPHDTYMQQQNRASVEYADTSWVLLSPEQLISTIHPATDEPIVFRWNKESAYQIRLESEGQPVLAVDSFGVAYTLPAQAALYESLDWTLTIEGKALKGRIFIQNK